MPMFYCSLSNADAKVQEPPHDLISDDPEEIRKFIEREDRPNRGVFVNRNKLKPGAVRRAKETIDEVLEIPIDIDAKDIQESPATVEQRLAVFPCPPTRINDSGHGRHAFWVLKEPVSTADAAAMAVLETVHKQLVGILCGDAKVSHHAALVRAVGSHNTKFGEWLEVRTIKDEGPTYYLEELADKLADIEHPIFTRKKTNGATHAATEAAGDDCWSQFGEMKEPVDVDARLAAMQHQGPSDAAVHPTQLDCMNALLGRGTLLSDAVARVLDATMRLDRGWNRRQEEQKLRAIGESFLQKFPEVCERHDWDPKGNPRPNERIIIPHPRVDPLLLPQRGFIYGDHYLRRSATGTCAPGGGGKSITLQTEAMALATGRDLLGFKPARMYKVFYYNAEETEEEIVRRRIGICQRYGIADQEWENTFYSRSGFDRSIKLAKQTNGKVEFDEKLIRQIMDEIEYLSIDVVILDPLVSLHNLSENDNGQMDALVKKLGWMAYQRNCSVEVAHHSRKGQPGQTDMLIDDVRGGSSLVDGLRGVRVGNHMSVAEATKFGIDPIYRKTYVAFDRAKNNYAGPGERAWYHLEVQTLPNGDRTVVPVQWTPPTPETESSPADAEWARGEVLQKDWQADTRAKTGWFGHAVAKRLNLNLYVDKDKAKVKRVIQAWLETGALTVEIRKNQKGDERQFLTPGSRSPRFP
jgi:hypothetical protein